MKLKTKREPQPFVHLHNHTMYSVLDGFGKLDEWAKIAHSKGFSHLGITNHGTLYETSKAIKDFEKYGIKPIFGCELYIVPNRFLKDKDHRKMYHLTTLVKNETGYINLMKILTSANLEGFYYKPRVDPELILNNCKGLFFMTGCASTVINMDGGINFIQDLDRSDAEGVFLEIMPHDMEEQKELNAKILGTKKWNKLPLVATNDCHYPAEQHTITQELLLAIQTNTRWNNPKRWRFEIDGLYLKSYKEMIASFKVQGVVPENIVDSALEITKDIAEECTYKPTQQQVFLPLPPSCEGKEDIDSFIEQIMVGWEDRVEPIIQANLNLRPEYESRLREEVTLISSLGFIRYFLIVWDLIHWCRNNNIMVGPGRGSSGGSLVCWLLYITAVNPIEYNLLFSRFMSPGRIDLPDIDMDFEGRRRNDIRKYLQSTYGEFHVAGVNSFMKIAGKGAIRDVGRIFSLPFNDVNNAANAIVTRSGGDARQDYSVADALATFEDGKRFKKKYPKESRLASQLEGTVRSVGMHAAGMVVSKRDLRDGTQGYLEMRKSTHVINWDKKDAELWGLMKLDVLGLNTLTILKECAELVERNHGVKIDYEKIQPNDPKIFSEFSKGNNIGTFQFSSKGLRTYTKELGIDKFDDLVAANALWRPGTLRSGLTEEYVLLKKGEKTPEYIHPIMKEITGETYGIILYQEQIMYLLYNMAGIGWRTVDTIRKVMGKSEGAEAFMKHEKAFIDGCVKKKTLDKETAKKVFDKLRHFGSYGFNRSHSVEYSLIGYWTMWAKVYYPAEFCAASLTYPSGDDKKEEMIKEAKRLGFYLVPPKVNTSTANNWEILKDGKTLVMPLTEVKGIGAKVAEKIVKEREESLFVDVEDFQERTRTKGNMVADSIREKLNVVGAFDETKKEFTDKEYNKMADYFSFDIRLDPTAQYRALGERLKDSIIISKLSEAKLGKRKKAKDRDWLYYWGAMSEVKFSYRGSIGESAKDSAEVEVTSDEHGSVYGLYDDGSAHGLMYFSKKLYHEDKDRIEHCEGDWMLAEAAPTGGITAMVARDKWFGEDLLKGEFGNLEVSFAKEVTSKQADYLDKIGSSLKKCEGCSLRGECKGPVPSTTGLWNIASIAESPGRDEDEAEENYVGQSGKKVWKELEKYGITKDMLHVANVGKCWPSETRKLKPSVIKQCRVWLDQELDILKPFLVLAYGNANMSYWLGEDSGITNMSGTTTWDAKRRCWICWCIHPAAMLHRNDEETTQSFKRGIKNFADKVATLGFGINLKEG